MHTSIHNLRYYIAAAGLLLVATVSGDPPDWWSEGDPPVVDTTATPNNQGPANVGQAKWMAHSAIEALRANHSGIASEIELLLVGEDKIIKTLTPSANDADREKNHAPLLVGQLKNIATPFYDALHIADPIWLETQLTDNQTKDPIDPANYYPWTKTPADDQNRAIATIGQLKAVFSLRFETLDADHDGLSDSWETTHFGNLNASGSQDSDSDGLDNAQEQTLGTNPRDSDSDDDEVIDGADAAPMDSLIDWPIQNVEKYAAIEMPEAVVQQANGQQIFCVEMTDEFDVMLNFIPTEFGTFGSSGFWKIGSGTFEAIPGASVTYMDTFWGQLTRESSYAAGMAGDSILYGCSAAVDWDFGGALVKPKNGSPFEFWEQLEKQNGEGYEAWPVGGDRQGRTVIFQNGDNNIFGGFPHAVWKLFRKADGNIDLSKIATLTLENQPHFDPDCHLSLTKEGWVSVYDKVISLAQGVTMAAPVPGAGDHIWSQDLPKGNKPNGRVLISRAQAPSGVYLLDKAGEWKTPKAFKGKLIIGATPCGAFLSANHELWTRDRPGTQSQNGTEDWIPLKDWAGQHIADLVEDDWDLNLQSTNKHGGMTFKLEKENMVTKFFVFIPVELRDTKEIANTDDDQFIESAGPVPTRKSGESDRAFWTRRNTYFQKQIPDSNIAWIAPHRGAGNTPDMPRLVAKVKGAPAALRVRWRLEVEYLRGNGYRASYIEDFTRPEDKVMIPPSAGNNPAYTDEINGNQEWRMFESAAWQTELAERGFFGGTAKIYLWIPSASPTAPLEPLITFRIGGKNPDQALARTFLDTTGGAEFSYFYAIARHETFGRVRVDGANRYYNQFYTDYRGGPIGDASVDMGWAAWAKGWPLYNLDRGRNSTGRYQNGPGGYGMYQLTLGPKHPAATVPASQEQFITRRQIWNWQDNVLGAAAELQGKRNLALALRDGLATTYPLWPPLPNEDKLSGLDAIVVSYYNGTGGLPSVKINKTSRRTPWTQRQVGNTRTWQFHQNQQEYVQAVNAKINTTTP